MEFIVKESVRFRMIEYLADQQKVIRCRPRRTIRLQMIVKRPHKMICCVRACAPFLNLSVLALQENGLGARGVENLHHNSHHARSPNNAPPMDI